MPVCAQDLAAPIGDDDSVDVISRGRVDDVDSTFQRQLELGKSWEQTQAGEFFKPWRDWRESFFKDIGLDLSISYDSLFQGYVSGGDTVSGSAGELRLDGRWVLFGEKFGAPTRLGFRLRDRHGYGSATPADMGEAIGAYWGTIRGFNNRGLEIPDLYLEHELFEGDLDIRWGQMSFTSLFDGNSLRSAKQAFGNRAFSGSPAINFPSYGAGIYLRWLAPHGIEISAGASNIMGTSDQDVVSFDLSSSELFEATQIAWNFKGYRGEKARLQATFWHSDAITDESLPAGNGFSLTYEQAFCNDRLKAFARFGSESGDSTDVDRMFSLGGAMKMRRADYLGAAMVMGRKSQTDDYQYVLETYYRWQVGPELQISPSMQILAGKGFYDGNGPHFIFALRGQVTF